MNVEGAGAISQMAMARAATSCQMTMATGDGSTMDHGPFSRSRIEMGVRGGGWAGTVGMNLCTCIMYLGT